MPVPVSASAPPAQRFGKYQILERVAAGGMAEVFKARMDGEGGFQRLFAIKRILPHLSSRPEFVEMLVEEAKIAGLLSHANIVQILDLGEVDGTCFVAMEYVDGPDLGRIFERCRKKGIALPVPHATFIVAEVLKALEYAHTRRVMRGGKELPLEIVHRDVSPGNVLISYQGEVKLTDFGIARASVKALETVSGVVKGRFDTMAPEQAAGQRVDARADIFAMGVLFYECLTGRHPFRRANEGATLDAIRAGSFEPASQVNPDVPYPLEQVLEKALAVDPADRYATATEMKEALDRFFHESGFIFSHSTLAAFLRGLFPQAAKRNEPAPARQEAPGDPTEALPEAAPRARGVQRLQRSPGDPFAVADSTARKAAAAAAQQSAAPRSTLAQAADLPEIEGAPPVAGFGEEATLIRPQPGEAQSASPGAGLNVSEWGEAETVIKPMPAGLQTPPNRPVSKPVPAPRSAQPSPKTRWGLHAAWLAFTLAMSAAGVVLGLVLGQLTLGSRLTPAEVPDAPRHPPQLRVFLPAKASLVLDGKETGGGSPIDLSLSAGVTHRIEVRQEGFEPFDTRVVLQENEVRILRVQQEVLPSSGR